MEDEKKVVPIETTELRKIQSEIIQVLENNNISYGEAEKILSGLASAVKDLATKQDIKNPF